MVRLPGELQAYEAVAVFPKVTAYVDSISVDRGSHVKTGQLMARLVAPELAAQRAEAESKLQAAESQRAESQAKLSSDESTYQRLKSASATPGVVAGNDLEIAQRAVDADRARLEASRGSAEAAKSALKSVADLEGYLQVRAPFNGIVTERNVHPGSLVGPSTGASSAVMPMLRLEKADRLRLAREIRGKYRGRNEARIQCSGVSRAKIRGARRTHRAFRGCKNTHHARRARSQQCGWTLEFGNVSGSTVGRAPNGTFPVRSRVRGRENNGSDLRCSHSRWQHGMGERPNGGTRRQIHRSYRWIA